MARLPTFSFFYVSSPPPLLLPSSEHSIFTGPAAVHTDLEQTPPTGLLEGL